MVGAWHWHRRPCMLHCLWRSDRNILVVYDCQLHAGGRFTRAGGVSASHIARWNGTEWSTLGRVSNPATFTMCTLWPSTTIHCTWEAAFTMANGMPLNSIARWNGTTWSALGPGLGWISTAIVYALAFYNNSLYAGGRISTAGGMPRVVLRVERRHGHRWD